MANAEGVFRIIDRASGPMRRMEMQAQATDRAIARLGVTTDLIGGQKQQRQLNDLDRSYRTFGRTADDTFSKVRRGSRDMEQHERQWRSLRERVTQVGAAIRGVGAIFGVLKLPALGAGIGIAAQGIGALAGGIIALLPRVADLGGAVGALGPGIAGLGLAMVTARLATSGLSQALHGNRQAMQRLTPQAREFVRTLREYHGIAQQLRGSAQGGLFAGLNTALPRLTRGLPVANQLLSGMSRTLGGLAVQAANRVTTPQFLQDILGIGQAGTRAVGRGGTALINILSGMRHLTVAAIPFTDAITRALVRFSQWFDKWAQFQRDSGRAGAFFERSRRSFNLFGNIVKNLWQFFEGLGRAARGTGDSLWAQAERATRAWAKYANSVRGQVSLTRDFVQMREAVTAIVTLIDNLGRAIFRMGTSQSLPGTIRMLDQLVPALEKLLNQMANQWGPIVASVLVQIADTLGWLTSGTGPVTIFLTLIDRMLKLINRIVNSVPGLNRVFAAAFSVLAVGVFINRLQAVANKWWQIASGARAAAVAQKEALAAGAGGGGAGGGMFVLPGGGGGAAAAAEGRTASGLILPASATARGGSLAAEAAAGTGIGARMLGGGRAVGGRLAGLAGRWALPITAALGAYGAVSAPTSGSFFNQATQRLYAGVNTVSFGALGAGLRAAGVNTGVVLTPEQIAQRNISRSLGASGSFGTAITAAGGQDPRTRAQISRQVALYEQQIADYSGRQGTAYADAVGTLRQQLTVLRQVGAQLRRNQAFTETAGNMRFLRQEGRAFDVLSGKFGKAGAAARTNTDVLSRIKSLKSPQAKLSLAQSYMKWLSGEDKRDPAEFGAALQSFERHVGGALGVPNVVRGGHIVAATPGTWGAVRRQLLDPVERAHERGQKKLTDAQERAVLILSLLGVPPTYAASLVKEIENQSISKAAKWTAGLAQRVSAPAAPHGGPIAGAGGGGATSLQSGITGVMDTVLGKFPGLTMTSGVRPGDTGSYHSIGEAVDLAGPPGLMGQAARWISANMGGSLLEGIHNTGLSIKNGKAVEPGFWGASTWAGHANHIHLAAANGAGARGNVNANLATGTGGLSLSAKSLMPRKAGLRGVPGTLADQVGMLFASRVASNTNNLATDTTSVSPVAGGISGSNTANQKLAYQMMLGRWPASEWGALKALWTGESNFDNMARNSSSGAFGIPQALPASKMGARAVAGDAAAQIAWGLSYIGGRYGTPTEAYKQWSGRSPHWYRDGGSGVYRRPAMIGVGDSSVPEKVTVTPLHAGARGGRGSGARVEVNIEHISYHGEGDIAKVVWREMEAVANLLENQGTVGDEETM